VLPVNGQVGVPFEYTVPMSGLHDPRIYMRLSPGVEPTALAISGTPIEAGEYAVFVEGVTAEGTSIKRELQWTVVADPRSMWTSMPSDTSAPYHKPDSQAFTLSAPEALVIGASQRGRSHAKEGLHRDDDFAFTRTTDGWLVCAAADGAGSHPFSREGARRSVEYVNTELPALLAAAFANGGADALAAYLDSGSDVALRERLHESLVAVCHGAADNLAAFAQAEGRDVRDFSTTLVVVVSRKIGQTWFAAGFAIGDGGAAVYSDLGVSVHLLSHPEGGDYAGQTRFLGVDEFMNDAVVAQRLILWKGPTPTAILLMTDGVSDPFFESDDDWGQSQRWGDLWRNQILPACNVVRDAEETAGELLSWLNFYVPGHHDDRTIVLVVPKES